MRTRKLSGAIEALRYASERTVAKDHGEDGVTFTDGSTLSVVFEPGYSYSTYTEEGASIEFVVTEPE